MGLGSQYFLKCKYRDYTGLSVNSLSHYTGLNYSALLRPPQECAGTQSMPALVGWMESGLGHSCCQNDRPGPREAARALRHKGVWLAGPVLRVFPKPGEEVVHIYATPMTPQETARVCLWSPTCSKEPQDRRSRLYLFLTV